MRMSLPVGSAGTRGNSNDQVHRHNLSTILTLVHQARGLSRSQLTHAMGLNRSTIAALVSELIEHDLVREESAESTNQVGRPSLMVRPSATPVGFAVNPENDAITVAVVGLGGRVLTTVRQQLSQPPTAIEAASITAQIIDTLRPQLIAEHRIAGIGVAVPGLVRETDGLVQLAPHLGWRGEPFAEMLQEATHLPVSAANDSHLGARAESSFGSGRSVKDLIYVNGGASGIGGGIIANGMAVSGTGGYAGELGHTMVNPTGIECHCGAFGCLETEVRRDRLLEVTGLTSESVDRLAGALALSADPRVRAEVTRQLDMLIIALRNAINLFNPRLIVLGGFLAALQSADPTRLEDFGRNRPLDASFRGVDILPSELAGDLLMIGASELAFEALLADPTGFFE